MKQTESETRMRKYETGFFQQTHLAFHSFHRFRFNNIHDHFRNL